MNVRLVRVAAVALALLAAGSSCSERSDAAGAGSDIDGCAVYFILDFLDEPSPDKPREVEQYAAAHLRILNRLRPDFRIQRSGDREDIDLPKSVADDFETMKRSVRTFQAELKAAGGDEGKVRAAMNAFAADEAYAAADARIGEFSAAECPRF